MQRITIWCDGFEVSAEQIIAIVGAAEVLAGEARYSARNALNRDSLELKDALELATAWPLVEEAMDDDSLNCLALVVRADDAEATRLRAALAELEPTDAAGIWQDITDDPAAPLIIGAPPCHTVASQTRSTASCTPPGCACARCTPTTRR